jgi:hypothetical protein
MMQFRRTASGFAAAILATGLLAGACGDDRIDEPTTPGLPLSVEGLIIAEPDGDVAVVGFLVIDSGGQRLCQALAESFPPQCGGSSVDISGIDALEVQFEETQGVRWTDPAIVLEGRFTDGTFEVQGLG